MELRDLIPVLAVCIPLSISALLWAIRLEGYVRIHKQRLDAQEKFARELKTEMNTLDGKIDRISRQLSRLQGFLEAKMGKSPDNGNGGI